MWLSSLEARGLESCDDVRSLDRLDTLPRPWMDALLLFVMGACEDRAVPGAERLGWEPELGEDLLLESPDAVQAMRVDQAERAFQITLTILPDPPLFGRLRNAVIRTPAHADGLAEGTLTARIGWLFTPDLQVAQPDLIGARLGSVDLALNEAPWVPPLLTDIMERVHFLDWRTPLEDTVEAFTSALWAPERERRERAEAALADLKSAFDLDLRPIRTHRTRLGVGPDLRPLRWLGPGAERILRTVVGAQIHAPDVLVVPWVPQDAERAWLEARCTGDDAVLEQLLVADTP